MLPYHTLSIAVVMKGVRKNIVTTPTTMSTQPYLYIFCKGSFKKVIGGRGERGEGVPGAQSVIYSISKCAMKYFRTMI